MKKHRLSFILLISLISLLFAGTFVSVKGSSTSDLYYTPTEDVFYNATIPVYDESVNIRNQQSFTGNYNGTYSFTGEIGLNGTDIPFIDVDTSSTDTGVIIVDSWENHNEVIKFYDNSSTEALQVNHDFGAIYSNGTYEFWWAVSDIGNKYLIMQYRENTDLRVSIKYQSGNFYNYYLAFDIIKSGCTVNTWYHHKLIFDDSLNSFDWYINGVLEGDDLNYYANSTIGFDNNNWVTASAPVNYSHYFDGFGYFGDPFYDVGDNLIPLIEELGTNEVDRWEFALLYPDQLNPVGLDDPNGWQDYEESGDIVNIGGTGNDRYIYMFSTSYNNGIFKDDFIEEESQIVEIKWNFQYYVAADQLIGNTTLKVYSNGSNEVCRINLFSYWNDNIRRLEYFNGSNYVDLTNNNFFLNGYTPYDFYLYINYYDNIAFLSYQNSTDYESWYFPLIVSGEVGVNKVEFFNYEHVSTVQNLPMRLDSIGVYCDGVSQSNEWAWKSIDLPANWDIRDNNLLYGDYIGLANISVCEGSYSVGISDFYGLFDMYWYPYDMDILNIHNKYVAVVIDPYLLYYQINWLELYEIWNDVRSFVLEDLSINGVTLVQDSNVYDMVYSAVSDYPVANYFYVIGTDLYYTLTCYDSDLEYIQGVFDITNIPTQNRSIDFDAYIDGFPFLYCEGAITLGFGDATTYGFVFDEITSFNQILPQEKLIDKITILITDNDVDAASGSDVTGHVNLITLVYYSNISVTILTLDLLAILIPLLVLITPPLALYKKFEEPKVVVPMLMLMSFVCVATGLISYPMFFVMMICFVVFLLIQKKRGGFGEV